MLTVGPTTIFWYNRETETSKEKKKLRHYTIIHFIKFLVNNIIFYCVSTLQHSVRLICYGA